MSCLGMASSAGWPLSPSLSRSSSRRRGVKPWRRWWRRCAGLAAAIHSKIRRRAVRWPGRQGGGRRRREATGTAAAASMREGWCHHRSSTPVYVDELYSHPKTLHVTVHDASSQRPSTSGAGKVAARPYAANNAAAAAANNDGSRGMARAVAANNVVTAAAATNAGASGKYSAGGANNTAIAAAMTNAGDSRKGRARGAKKDAAAATNGGGKARGGVRSLLMSPLRGMSGMGEVDVRAEVFIRKFREEMGLQNQKSAEEFHAMLARGL